MLWLKKSIAWTLLVSVIALNAGCAAPAGNYCDIARPIWWETTVELDSTPPGIVRQVMTHNETIETLCR